jgi:hypothetical protein
MYTVLSPADCSPDRSKHPSNKRVNVRTQNNQLSEQRVDDCLACHDRTVGEARVAV